MHIRAYGFEPRGTRELAVPGRKKNLFMGVFADNIRDIRVEKGLSQQQVAEHIGTSLTQVRRWEGGQTAPSIDNAMLLARFYHVSLDRLCGLQDRPDLDLEGLNKAQIEALKAVVEGFRR